MSLSASADGCVGAYATITDRWPCLWTKRAHNSLSEIGLQDTSEPESLLSSSKATPLMWLEPPECRQQSSNFEGGYACCALHCKLCYTLCLPCVASLAFSWGQPRWQELGFSGLVHKETHLCGSNFIQSIFLNSSGWVHQQSWSKLFHLSVTRFEKKIIVLLQLLSLLFIAALVWELWVRRLHEITPGVDISPRRGNLKTGTDTL